MLHPLQRHLVIRRVARDAPVIDKRRPKVRGFPKVVRAGGRRTGEDPGDLTGLVAVVKGHEVVREGFGGDEDVYAGIDFKVSGCKRVSREGEDEGSDDAE